MAQRNADYLMILAATKSNIELQVLIFIRLDLIPVTRLYPMRYTQSLTKMTVLVCLCLSDHGYFTVR
jgi:hypothetical protein